MHISILWRKSYIDNIFSFYISGCSNTNVRTGQSEATTISDKEKLDLMAVANTNNFTWDLCYWENDFSEERFPKEADIYKGNNEYDYGGKNVIPIILYSK